MLRRLEVQRVGVKDGIEGLDEHVITKTLAGPLAD